MNPLSTLTADLSDDVVVDAGVIMAGSPLAGIGTLMGGIKFDPGKTVRQIGYDGQRADLVGGDRIIRWKPTLSFTMQELGSSTTGKQLALLEQGSAETDSGHQSTLKGRIRTITPKTGGVLYSTGDYVAPLYAVLQLGGAGIYQFATILFPYAYCAKYDLQTGDGVESKIAATFEARLSQADAIATPGKCPYVIELHEKLPS